jgi:streptomycin 6-kinase
MSDNVWLGRPIAVPNLAAFLRWVERMPAYAISYGGLDQAWALVDRALANRAETEATADAIVRPAPATS